MSASVQEHRSSRPPQVVAAIKLAALNMILGYVSIAFAWDYYTRLLSPTTILLGQVIGLLFTIFLYYNIYVGRNWARVLLLVLFILAVVMFIGIGDMRSSAVMTGPPLSRITRGIGFLITLYVLWLLFMSPARSWFRKDIAHSVA